MDYYELLCTDLVHTTKKAFYFLFGRKKVWVGKTLILRRLSGNKWHIVVPQWWVKRNKLFSYITKNSTEPNLIANYGALYTNLIRNKKYRVPDFICQQSEQDLHDFQSRLFKKFN